MGLGAGFIRSKVLGGLGARNALLVVTVAARGMRQILIDHDRKRRTARCAGEHADQDKQLLPAPHNGSDVSVLALDEALTGLTEEDARAAEVVELRYFGGLTMAEIAGVLQTPKRAVERDWTLARLWLSRHLS